jgi:hypothetical protein
MADILKTAVLRHTIEICRRTISYYDQGGEWLGGSSRTIGTQPIQNVDYDSDDREIYGNPVTWATAYIRDHVEVMEASMDPIPWVVEESAWLSGQYDHLHDNLTDEVTARLIGDWTGKQRAEVFRAVVGEERQANQ